MLNAVADLRYGPVGAETRQKAIEQALDWLYEALQRGKMREEEEGSDEEGSGWNVEQRAVADDIVRACLGEAGSLLYHRDTKKMRNMWREAAAHSQSQALAECVAGEVVQGLPVVSGSDSFLSSASTITAGATRPTSGGFTYTNERLSCVTMRSFSTLDNWSLHPERPRDHGSSRILGRCTNCSKALFDRVKRCCSSFWTRLEDRRCQRRLFGDATSMGAANSASFLSFETRDSSARILPRMDAFRRPQQQLQEDFYGNIRDHLPEIPVLEEYSRVLLRLAEKIVVEEGAARKTLPTLLARLPERMSRRSSSSSSVGGVVGDGGVWL